MADVRLGAKTVYLINTILLYSMGVVNGIQQANSP